MAASDIGEDLLPGSTNASPSSASYTCLVPSLAGVPAPQLQRASTASAQKVEANPQTHKAGENDRWGGRDRRHLSEKGYKTLALLATFMAATQSQVLSATLSNDGKFAGLINALFIAGLLSNIFGAILSYASARWFEMLTKDESEYLLKCWADAERGPGDLEKGKMPSEDSPEERHSEACWVDMWTSISIKAGPPAVVLGLVFFILGLLVFIWAQQPMIVRVLSTLVCCFFIILIPPFMIRHNRPAVLAALRLKRRSG